MTRRTILKLPGRPDLAAELATRIGKIPRGRITTFGDLARSLGDRHAAVWVAQSIAQHAHTRRCRCHRVLRVTGELELRTDAAKGQLQRLLQEGVPVADRPAGGLRAKFDVTDPFTDFGGIPPLKPLADWLDRAANVVRDEPLRSVPRTVAGFDVAYPGEGRAIAAGVVIDRMTKEVLWSDRAEAPVDFPYLPGYLAFRELPSLLAVHKAMHDSGYVPDVNFIDGQGRLHPRRAGIATDFAAVTGEPTIGVGKSLLCGRVAGTESPADVVDAGERIGVCLRNHYDSRPVYVSVGGYLTLDEAVALTREFFAEFRLPLPTHRADRLSKRPG